MKVFKTSALASGNSKLHPPYLEFHKLGVKLIEPGMFKSKETFDYYEDIDPVSIETKLIGFATVNIHGRNIRAELHGFSNTDAKQIRDLVMLSKTSKESLMARIGEFTYQEPEPTPQPSPVATPVNTPIATPSSIQDSTATSSNVSASSVVENKIPQKDTYKHVKMMREIKTKDVIVYEGITDFEMMLLPNDVRSVKFPASLRNIEEGCDGFPMLETVDFSKVTMLEEIPDMLFVGCSSLKEVVFPHGVEIIGTCVFDQCTNLERIIIPETVEKLAALYSEDSVKASVFLFCPPSEDMEFFGVPYKRIYVTPKYLDAYKDMFVEEDMGIQIQPIADEYLNKYYSNGSNVVPDKILPPPPPSFSFYAMIENKQRGPYNKIQFKRLVDEGLVKSDNYVWAEGMSEWKKAKEVDDMKEFFPNTGIMPPPLP